MRVVGVGVAGVVVVVVVVGADTAAATAVLGLSNVGIYLPKCMLSRFRRPKP
jgi:hypothetical protein